MRKLLFTTLLFLPGLTNSTGQIISQDSYCIKLKQASGEKYFSGVNLDTIPDRWRNLYEMSLSDDGRLLSRFGELSLKSNSDIFRSVTFGAFNNPKDVNIFKIEKHENHVEICLKFIQKLKDSTIYVHKVIMGTEAWDSVRNVAEKFLSQPSFKHTEGAIHDGGPAIFEGYVFDKYYFLQRRNTDADLSEFNRLLFMMAGNIFGIDCKKNLRQD